MVRLIASLIFSFLLLSEVFAQEVGIPDYCMNSRSVNSNISALPPTEFQGFLCDSTGFIILTWDTVNQSNTGLDLLYFNLYMPGGIIRKIDQNIHSYPVIPKFDNEEFHLSACYFNESGDTIESEKAGPVNINVDFYELPFFETFESGSYATNHWTHESGWEINNSTDGYSASFNDSQQTQSFHSSLYSQWFDLSKFYYCHDTLEYDLHLLASSDVIFQAEVFNGTYWIVVAADTANSSDQHIHQSIPISYIFKGHNSRLRFTVRGGAVSSIDNLELDNIRIKSELLQKPKNLKVEPYQTMEECGFALSWDFPKLNINPSTEIHWTELQNHASIGTSQSSTYNVAIRFTENQLLEFGDNIAIRAIKYFAAEPGGKLNLRIWRGVNPQLIVDVHIPYYEAHSWNIVWLPEPVLIEGSDDIYIGFLVKEEKATSIIGVDEGNAVVGYGDLINNGTGWKSLAYDYAMSHNFNIRALLQELPTSFYQYITDTVNYYQGANFELFESNCITYDSASLNNNPREILGFQIFRNDNPIKATTENNFNDTSDDLIALNEYCYTVKTVSEYLISDPSKTVCNIACVPEVPEKPLGFVYPNPATSQIRVNVLPEVKEVIISDFSGHELINLPDQTSDDLLLDLRNFKNGLYFIKLITDDGRIDIIKFVVADR